MRWFRSVGILLVVAGLSLCASAADVPTAEAFGGVSWLHVDNMGATTAGLKSNYMGWDSALAVNLNRWLGVKADIGGYYGPPVPGATKANLYNFLFGPQISIRGEHAKPFVHVLFGVNRISNLIGSSSDSAFAMAAGAGLDLKMSSRFALRLGQLDWLYTRHDATGVGLLDHQNNIRYSGGIVISFGNH